MTDGIPDNGDNGFTGYPPSQYAQQYSQQTYLQYSDAQPDASGSAGYAQPDTSNAGYTQPGYAQSTYSPSAYAPANAGGNQQYQSQGSDSYSAAYGQQSSYQQPYGMTNGGTAPSAAPMVGVPGQGTPGQGAPMPGTPMYQVNPGSLFDSVLSSDDLPQSLRPLSVLDYVGYLILFQLPIVGFIMIIFYSIKAKNQNLKNFARAILLLGVIVVVLYIIVLLLLGDSLGNLSSGSSLTSV